MSPAASPPHAPAAGDPPSRAHTPGLAPAVAPAAAAAGGPEGASGPVEVFAGGTYRLSRPETVAIVAGAAPAAGPSAAAWPTRDDAWIGRRPAVRQIFEEVEEGPVPPGAGAGGTMSQEEVLTQRRLPHDVPWFLLFLALMGFVGYVSISLGLQRWNTQDGGYGTIEFWPMYLAGEGIACFLAYALLSLLALYTNHMMKIFVHGLTTYLAVISVFCFWDREYFWGLFFALGAALQFAYAIAVVDRLAYTMLVVRKALGFVRRFPLFLLCAHAAVLLLAAWFTLWSFGLSGVVARQEYELGRWWVIVLLAASAFWAGLTVSNFVHVMTADIITSWLLTFPDPSFQVSMRTAIVAPSPAAPSSIPSADGNSALPVTLDVGATGNGQGSAEPREGTSTEYSPTSASRLLAKAFARALMGLGSICYGSLFTAPVSVMHWLMRGLRARFGQNECMFCICSCLFNAVETLTRFLNRFGYVTLAMHGQGFNRSSMDAWELFQATGVEALIAYDLSSAVVLMAITLGSLLTGTAVGVWAWFVKADRVVMVGATTMLIAALLVSVTMTVVDAAVSAVYVVFAEDPTLLGAVDAQFVAQLSEALLLRLQKRSGHRIVINLASSGLPNGVPPH